MLFSREESWSSKMCLSQHLVFCKDLQHPVTTRVPTMSTKETLDICFLVGSHSRHSNQWMLWIHDKGQQHSHSWLHCYELRRLYGILLAAHSLFTSVRKCLGHVRGHSSITMQVICTPHGFIILMCQGMCVCPTVA